MNQNGILGMTGRSLLLGLLALTAIAPSATAQATFELDRTRSLVWWQIDPHFGHLWATSCPKDPSWQPGEGHSAGHYMNYAARPRIATTKSSESKIPLFPRRTVRPNCAQAVSGTFTTSDAKRWSDFKGRISMMPDSIDTGANFRNDFAKKYVYSTNKYPTVEFAIDSLTAVAIVGDTVDAVAVGTFKLRGKPKPSRVRVRAVTDPAGLRVRGMFAMPASELRDYFGVSQWAMGAGIGLKLWDTLFMGFDLIMVPENASAGS